MFIDVIAYFLRYAEKRCFSMLGCGWLPDFYEFLECLLGFSNRLILNLKQVLFCFLSAPNRKWNGAVECLKSHYFDCLVQLGSCLLGLTL